MYKDLAKLSIRNVKTQDKRSWITIIGVIIGITAVVSLISLGQALETTIESEFEDLGADIIYIVDGEGLQGFFTGELSDTELELVRNSRGVEVAGPMYYGSTSGVFQGQSERVAILGIPTDESQELVMSSQALNVDSGRELRDTDQNNILIGSSLTDDHFDNPVDLRRQVRAGQADLRVVGILETTGDPEWDSSLVMRIERARELFESGEDISSYIVARPQQGLEPGEVASDIEEQIRRDRGQMPGEEDFTVSTADDLLDSYSNILGTVQAVVIGLASISLLVGGIGIMNTMYMAVTERTQEIGVMKAVGAEKKHVKTIFLIESGLIGLIGGFIGLVTGYAVTEIAVYGINSYVDISFSSSYSVSLIAGTLLFSFFIGTFSGYLPAKRAADLEPVEALREE